MIDLKDKTESVESSNSVNKIKNFVKVFKDKLMDNLKINNKERILGIKGIKTFKQGEEKYCKMIRAGRYVKAVFFLRTMCKKASTKSEKFKLKGYILSGMLTGMIKNNSTKDIIKSFSNMAKKIRFGPLSWITDVNHPEKLLNLLNGISELDKKIEKLPDVVDFNIKDHMCSSPQGYDYGEFNLNFQKYWDKNGEQILKHIDGLETNINEK